MVDQHHAMKEKLMIECYHTSSIPTYEERKASKKENEEEKVGKITLFKYLYVECVIKLPLSNKQSKNTQKYLY